MYAGQVGVIPFLVLREALFDDKDRTPDLLQRLAIVAARLQGRW